MATDKQGVLFDGASVGNVDVSRSLLDQLLTDSKLYRSTDSYKELLSFVVRLRNVAPFNAMLLQLQKPGLTYAASAYDWATRFGRWVKDDARPLLILWPFGPVATVYDVQDTDGKPLPLDVASFFASGHITAAATGTFRTLVQAKKIDWQWIDAGDAKAGSIQVVERGDNKEKPTRYRLKINRNHEAAVQFTTLAHELGHLYLGHLGADKRLTIPKRRSLDRAEVELEAESVAYLVCARNGVKAKSETYLSNFVKSDTDLASIDVYQIMRAAGQVESLLNLTAHTKFQPCESQVRGGGALGRELEILPRLKIKYGEYVRPDLISVKFGQRSECCYLELTIRTKDGSNHRAEGGPQRTDLDFVVEDENGLMFDPQSPFEINVHRFLEGFDEYSIINCTDLFTKAACEFIDASYRNSHS